VLDGDFATWIGTVIAGARREHRWGQRELARRLSVSQSAVARLEAGRLRVIDVDLATRAFRELGIRPLVDSDMLGLASRREQADVVHARCLGVIARRLRSAGWESRIEVEVGSGRTRGWIDLLSFRGRDGALLVTEFKSLVRDVGAIQRTCGWYAREAWTAARQVGWRPRQASVALILLASAENDAALIANRSLLRTTFPGGAAEVSAWIEDSGPAPPWAIAMIDPRSRRSRWLIGTRSDGRRTPAPYLDYADAARRLG
jgi:transcriptional regulator with XRE-family HTH domain